MKFLDDFEMNLTTEESVSKLRSQEIYNNFLQSWNLPVYFQIRFQEIAKPLETLLNGIELVKSNSGCNLKVT